MTARMTERTTVGILGAGLSGVLMGIRLMQAGIDDFVPDESVYLFGGALSGRFRTASATLRYQRELLADRSGLASERASFDGSMTLPRVRLSGGIDWDFGRAIAGKGHLTASAPMGNGRWMLSASAKSPRV